MSTSVADKRSGLNGLIFGACVLLFMFVASAFTIVAPIAVSVMIVFLFAGPHNYAEARYFLTRLPGRMGRLKPFFLVSCLGVLLLSASFPLPGRLPAWMGWSPMASLWLTGLWNTLFIGWCTTLVIMRSQLPPRHDWEYAAPVGLAAIGLSWLSPGILPFVLVYAHPLMGLWILDRELKAKSVSLQRVFRWCLCLLPALIVLQWNGTGAWESDVLRLSSDVRDQILRHSSLPLFAPESGPRLVAVHAFLELLHYGVWLIAIPVVSGRVYSAEFASIPVMKTSLRTAIRWGLLLSALVVVLLWLFFLADYRTTRDLYFTVATIHVLAEIPFLLRLL